MIIGGGDFHTRLHKVAMLDPGAGDVVESWLAHEMGGASSVTFKNCCISPRRTGIESSRGQLARESRPRGNRYILDFLCR